MSEALYDLFSERPPVYETQMDTAFVHIVVDNHPRVAYAEIRDDEKTATTIDVLRHAVTWFAERRVTVEKCCRTTARPASPSPG